MALLARTIARPDTSQAMFASQIPDLYAGEALDAGAPCYIKAADGRVYMSNGTAANEAAKVHGFTPRAATQGEPITLLGPGARFRYGTGLTPGTRLFLGATAGRFDTAATTGGTAAIAFVVNATDVVVAALAP